MIMPKQHLRYEYRIFCDDPLSFTKRIDRSFSKLEEKSSSETYLLFSNRKEYNLKIRDEHLDIKQLVERREGFQKWRPIPPQEIAGVLEELGLRSSSDDLSGLIQECGEREDASVAELFKSRTLYARGDVLTEIATGEIEGEPYASIAAESSDLEQLSDVVKELKLAKLPNTSYIEKLLQQTRR